MLHRRVVSILSLAGLGALVLSASPAYAVAPPIASIVITAPTQGAHLVGATSVTFAGLMDPSTTNVPWAVQLIVDGVTDTAPGDTDRCAGPVGTTQCDGSLAWDTTKLAPGPHTLADLFTTVDLNTAVLTTVQSSTEDVVVDHPTPDIVISSPTDGATAVGLLAITANGSTDSALTEFPSTTALSVDGVQVDAQDCQSPVAHTCAYVLRWNATKAAAGKHVLTVTMHTRDNAQAPMETVMSTPLSVYVPYPTTLTATSTGPIPFGKAGTVNGRLVRTADHVPVAGRTLTVTLGQVGAPGSRTMHAITRADGSFSVSFTSTAGTSVSVASMGDQDYAAASTRTFQKMYLQPTCRLLRSTVKVRALVKGICNIPGIGYYFPVNVQVLYRGVWRTAGGGVTGHSTLVAFLVKFFKKGHFALRIALPPTEEFLVSYSPAVRVTIV
jgi:hypothetical protein